MEIQVCSTAKARELLGDIGRTKLYELIAAGDLDARKIGDRTVITCASINALIERLPPLTTAGK